MAPYGSSTVDHAGTSLVNSNKISGFQIRMPQILGVPSTPRNHHAGAHVFATGGNVV